MKKPIVKKPKVSPELDELRVSYAKLQTEYLRLQEMHDKDVTNAKKRAVGEVVKSLSGLIDIFRQASRHAPTLDVSSTLSPDDLKKVVQYIEGTKQIEKQFEDVLSNIGLTRISTVGQVFDHNLHEAVTMEPSELPEETIIDEIEAGWLFDGDVIKPAKVRVSAGQ